jgi:hypothetical protein
VVYQASGRARARRTGGMKLRVRIGGVGQHIWCRRRALATFHGVVQGIAVGNIDECPATELW